MCNNQTEKLRDIKRFEDRCPVPNDIEWYDFLKCDKRPFGNNFSFGGFEISFGICNGLEIEEEKCLNWQGFYFKS